MTDQFSRIAAGIEQEFLRSIVIKEGWLNSPENNDHFRILSAFQLFSKYVFYFRLTEHTTTWLQLLLLPSSCLQMIPVFVPSFVMWARQTSSWGTNVRETPLSRFPLQLKTGARWGRLCCCSFPCWPLATARARSRPSSPRWRTGTTMSMQTTQVMITSFSRNELVQQTPVRTYRTRRIYTNSTLS